MIPSFFATILLGVHLAAAAPLYPRLTKLDPAATAEAQKKDTTATRALTGVPIKSSDGKCLNVVRSVIVGDSPFGCHTQVFAVDPVTSVRISTPLRLLPAMVPRVKL